MVRLHYSDVEVGILEVNTGQPLVWVHGRSDGLYGLHLERSLANTEVEEPEVQDEPVTPILFWNKEVYDVKHTPLLV